MTRISNARSDNCGGTTKRGKKTKMDEAPVEDVSGKGVRCILPPIVTAYHNVLPGKWSNENDEDWGIRVGARLRRCV